MSTRIHELICLGWSEGCLVPLFPSLCVFFYLYLSVLIGLLAASVHRYFSFTCRAVITLVHDICKCCVNSQLMGAATKIAQFSCSPV